MRRRLPHLTLVLVSAAFMIAAALATPSHACSPFCMDFSGSCVCF
ncbi:MAG: hypothetical protein AAF318_19820 [Pseudomonadota bacterium]